MILFALLLSTLTSPAHAGDWFATIVRSDNPKEMVGGLTWSAPDVKMVAFGLGQRPLATLKGVFKRPEWGLISGTVMIQLDEKTGEFSFELPMQEQAKGTPFQVMAIGPDGEVEYEKAIVYFEQAADVAEEFQKDPPRRDFILASAGMTFISYKETGVPDFSMTAITIKGQYQRLLFPPRWDFAVNAFFNLMPISDTRPDVSLRFLGINGRIGYTVPGIAPPWQLSLMGGWYFTTTIVSNNALGFVNLAGPQVFPVVRRSFRNGDTGWAYLKFSPLTNGVSLALLNLSNRELALGGGWLRPLKNGHPFSVMLDMSSFSFAVPKRNKHVDYTSFSLSVGYGL